MRKVVKLKEPRGRVRYLYSIDLIAISTGMRYGEIINLTWVDVYTNEFKSWEFDKEVAWNSSF
jgi:integrase